MTKNVSAIDKIIGARMSRDYHSCWDKLSKKKKWYFQTTGYGQFQITPGADTVEALEIKHSYLYGEISEEEYKAYCLKQNLLGI